MVIKCGVLQPVISDEPLEGDEKHRVVKFDRTPIMSTYLLAMIVGEYDFVEGRDADGVLVRVYTPVGKKEQGEFALNVSTFCDRLCSLSNVIGSLVILCCLVCHFAAFLRYFFVSET